MLLIIVGTVILILILCLVAYLYLSDGSYLQWTSGNYKFIGCYNDINGDRDLPHLMGYGLTFKEGLKLAKEAEYKYIGMQYPQGSGDPAKAEVWAGNEYGKHGEANCEDSLMHNNMYMGPAGINAVYEIF